MEPETGNVDTDALLKERFASLPKIVQDAITSADVQEHMRTLAESHKLHVDQWQVLENNVMLTLLGFQAVGELTQHLKKDLDLTDEVAVQLATSISEIVFKPIRSEMEQSLSHPTAVQDAPTELEAVRSQELAQAAGPDTSEPAAPEASQPTAAPRAPAAPVSATSVSDTPTPTTPPTPPTPAPETKVVRTQVAQTYASTASHERKSIEGDPYREQLI